MDAAVHRRDAAADARISPTCGATIASRITVTPVDVSADVRYRRLGYNLIPEDERIAFSIAPDGAPSIAWREAAGTRVHVTALDGTLAHRGADTVVDATDIGGLVAQRDGAALLVATADPGEPLAGSGKQGCRSPRRRAGADPRRGRGRARAAHRYEQRHDHDAGRRARLHRVTVERPARVERREVRSVLRGARLPGRFPLLVLRRQARVPRRRRPRASRRMGLGLQHRRRTAPLAGRDDVHADLSLRRHAESRLEPHGRRKDAELLAAEFSATGYSAGTLGSLVATSDGGFAVAWSSRGAKNSGGQTVADRSAPDIALLAMDSSYRVTHAQTWLTATPDVAELGVHLAPYGPGRLLLTWEAFGDLRCNTQTCEGTFQGTHARLIDATGRPSSADETIAATPNELEDIRLFPDGDLGFAFVDVANRDRVAQLSGDGGAPAPAVRTLSVARIDYCP